MFGFCSGATGPCRVGIVLLALVVLVVPPLVRATDSLKSSAAPLLRLNRGFNGPETKSKLAPPAAQPIDALAASEAAPPRSAGRKPATRQPAAYLPSNQTPDVLRGPPARANLLKNAA
jgi:hypothetical protein